MQGALFSELNNQMVKYHFKPSHKFAQNFIVNEKLLQEIVSAAQLTKKDRVLEIGAGTGFLTRELLKHAGKIIAVEKDALLCGLLEEEFKGEKKLEIIKGNFLFEKLPEFNKVVSLPPYSISSGIMLRLFELGFEKAVLVFQREFVEKLVAEPGFVEYNALSVLTTYFTEQKILEKSISPNSFYPKPNSFSSLVVLDAKKRFGSVNDELFADFLKQLFRLKNKNLSKALAKCFPFWKKNLKIGKEEFLETANSLELAKEKVNRLECREFLEVFKQILQ
ncbi:MAG: 16S rRNA (adenine(1518)-N(6)/adenine(1519)-N(6))-dimethyltransferase RsmA [Candidatus Diapherotrites archaeon]